MLRNIGVSELLIVLTIVLLLFGAKKIPQLARSMGQGIREFKGAVASSTEEQSVTGDPPAL